MKRQVLQPVVDNSACARLSRQGNIAVVTLCRPPVNAIDRVMLDELHGLHAELSTATDVGAVVVRSRQMMFSPGVDIRMIQGLLTDSTAGLETMAAFGQQLQAFYQAWSNLPMPTIAAMAGTATGGGLEFALACDLRVASVTARYGLPEARIGLLPSAGGTQMMTRLAGPGVASRLILTGELVRGDEARSLGIVQYAVDSDEVERRAFALAGDLCTGSAAAAREIKECIRLAPSAEGLDAEIAASRRLVAEPRAREMIGEFLRSRS